MRSVRTTTVYCALGVLALGAGTLAPAAWATPSHEETAHQPAPGAHAAAIARSAGEAARAEGVAVAAARAADQGVRWGKCPDVERLPDPVRCGTVTVPVDYADPDGETIDLTVSRLAAEGPAADHKGPLVYNPGGPGGNGMLFPLYSLVLGGTWKKLGDSYDLVGFAPRGVGRSAPVSCMDPAEYWKAPNHSPRLPSEEFKQVKNAEAAEAAAGCAERQGSRLAQLTTPNNARDLEVLRAALGQERLSYLGVSYGTYIGSVYATLFPDRVRAMVLDSVVDPSPQSVWYEANLKQSLAFEDRWNDWKSWVAEHHDTYRLGRTEKAVQRSFDKVRDRLDARPADGRVGSRELIEAYLDTGYTDDLWAVRAWALAEFRRGNSKPLVDAASHAPQRAVSAENGTAVYTTTECNDARWPRDFARWDRDNTAVAAKAPFITWENAWLNLPCAHWPHVQEEPLEVGAEPGALPPVLLLAATGDAATPYEGALELRRRLPDSVLVTERDSGTHGVGGGPNACVNHHLERYLLADVAPAEDTACTGRPAPEPVYGQPRVRAMPHALTGRPLGAVR
ncbi:alpha/beta hydrolase [Streptomyces alkaliterrae]|uniref:Alpha/beta fold hydrolase n=1 Tax=Streptomyces alkaliterrae TaxID=2213162 RepID=A0A5P0YQX0_9ACTN|nr:alpha/beta hydrolase [Streptomyces alkaliterrae]MBB1260849.1 alpha/beta fold hydrolase [Streptomyces alkaliterrae]MQS02714.1 alpha/beta fold hydrolase [Streptomyces alkaliterrae]